jgi:DNA ligase (NAD+)
MDFANLEKVEEIEKAIPILSDAYFNGEPLVSDVIFDRLVDKLKEKKPNSKILKQLGAPIREDKKKVKLPYWMGGMDKMKPNSNEMRLFFKKFQPPFLLSDKIDGAACLLEYNNGKLKGIYTRGDSGVGQDISFLKGFLKVPNTIKLKEKLFVKGELNVTLKDYINKFKNDATKSRGIVTGVFNSLEPEIEKVKALVFLGYEINLQVDFKKKLLTPNDILEKVHSDMLIKPSVQFKLMEKLGFKTPYYEIASYLDSEILIKYLEQRRKNTAFEIDGIIVSSDHPYQPVKKDIDSDRIAGSSEGRANPKHAIAFKVNEEGINSKVLSISWDPTKHGILFPVIHIEPIVCEGDTVKNVSGKNAKYILENDIGVGTILSIVKSGGVIPDIAEVVKSTKTSLPEDEDFGWDENEVNIVLDDPLKNEIVKMKRILHFFTALDIKGIKIGTIKKLYDAGFTSVKSICKSDAVNFLEADGIKERSAGTLYNSIHYKIDNPIEFHKIMFASLCFDKGLGTRRLDLLLKKLPSIYKLEIPFRDDIIDIEGFGEIVADQFLDGFRCFRDFMKSHSFLHFVKPQRSKVKSNGDFVVFSGFRDEALAKKLELLGATIEKNITKNTTIVVVKDLESTNSKVVKAKEKGLKLILKSNI